MSPRPRQAEWKAWVRNQPIDDDVLLVPKTTILPPDQWAAFLADHATELAWNEDLRRFAPPASRR